MHNEIFSLQAREVQSQTNKYVCKNADVAVKNLLYTG